MTRKLLSIPRSDVPAVDGEGKITLEWQQQLEELFDIVQKMADQIDAASGASSGNDVDDEWNAFVSAVKQDT